MNRPSKVDLCEFTKKIFDRHWKSLGRHISSQFSPSQERNEGTLAYPENVFTSSSQAMKSIVSSSQRPVEKHCINCQQDWHICVSLCWLAVMARQTVALHQFWGMLMSHQSRGCGLGAFVLILCVHFAHTTSSRCASIGWVLVDLSC